MLGHTMMVVIPARYNSQRLPGKLLAEVHGRPLIYWTYHRVKAAGIGNVVVAVDSPRMEKALEQYDIPTVRTSPNCLNGTERIYEVSKLFPEIDFFINVQGDEPQLNPEALKALLLHGLERGVFKAAISKVTNGDNPSEVKVALSNDNRIRFASRAPIPFFRTGNSSYYKIHGIYSYSREILHQFVSHKAGILENSESVEQLRCIEHDIPLVGVITPHSDISVDTQADLDYMRNLPKSHFIEDPS